ncbi:MAG: RcnB family protein [Alkalilacustris sp.]
MRCRGLAALALAVAGMGILGPQGVEARPGHCPPGLQNRAVPCVPPGQVRNAWRIGEPLPRGTRLVVLDDYRRHGLPRPAPGSRYVRVDEDILRIAIGTALVLESLGAIGQRLR